MRKTRLNKGEEYRMKLGIGSWTFPWAIGVKGYARPEIPMDAVGLIKKAYEMGVEVVQLCDNMPLHTLSMGELTKIRREAEVRGMIIEVGTRGIAPEHLLRYLKIAQILNSGFLRTILDTPNTAEGIKQALLWLKEILPQFEREGVVIGIENHERHLTKDLSGLVQALGSPSVGICLDTVNSIGALECPEQVIAALAPYTVCLHFKDFMIGRASYSMGFQVNGCPAGEGRLNIHHLFEVLKQHDREFNIILEQWPPFTGSIGQSIRQEEEWACKSIGFLKSFLSRHF